MKCSPLIRGLVVVCVHHIIPTSGTATTSFLSENNVRFLSAGARNSGTRDDGGTKGEGPLKLAPAQGIMDETESYADRAKAASVEARTVEHQLRVETGEKTIKSHTAEAAANADKLSATPDTAEHLSARTKNLAAMATKVLDMAKHLADETRRKAYANAKEAALVKVEALKKDAGSYYQELLDQLAALANPKDPKTEAANKAAMPYYEVELRTMSMVLQYNLKAQTLVVQAKEMVIQGHSLADQANVEQANGKSEMAMRHMIQAHGCMVKAQMMEDQAKKIYKLATELNSSVPTYQMAAQQAAAHVLATFSGLQLSGQEDKKTDDPLNALRLEIEDFERTVGKKIA